MTWRWIPGPGRSGGWRRAGGYATGEGFKVEGEWTHRNLFPPEGAFTVRATAGTKDQSLGAELRRSNAGKRARSLFVLTEAVRETRDAYSAYALRAAAGLQREPDIALERRWGYSIGSEVVATNQRDRSLFAEEGDTNGRRRTFFIVALPLQGKYDGSNDLLNPTRGFRVATQVTPEAAYQDGIFGYTRLRLDASAYLPLSGEDLVLAGRAALGSILGASRDRIAPSRRFYSGGGGSVRGFGFEELGPKDADNDPLGGRSLAEASAELRYRFGNYGLAAFVDAGQVYTDALPTFSDLRYGAGIGARYYTAFGPIRFDVATPLNRREGDPKVAVYISIGQAF
ncbi:autotransporter assembly complex protein TamA [Pedomonas mirosovicensis]|uniref:autotransporter assembly complex protein TamA n=1 Tax=Pedomonas mirosovicensis TaxID=2908641 RepID=UPI002167FB13|nr:BamA/TamA family outer membrane protein [Pedomonas mirosovicensis]MCH8686776.1 BamA/TamA family outer membrane protein [Pedomonas mirosovicensis]